MTVHSDVIIYDTETTGLIKNSAIPLKNQPHIIELFALRVNRDLEEVGVWHSLFKPPAPLSEETTRITGITDADLAEAPRFATMAGGLSEFFLGARTMIGHNLSYDRDMLAIELRRIGLEYRFPWCPEHICTVEASETLTGFRLNLGDLHERLCGYRFAEAHRAENDVRATHRVLKGLVEKGVVRL